jgi:hypothetical protein
VVVTKWKLNQEMANPSHQSETGLIHVKTTQVLVRATRFFKFTVDKSQMDDILDE